MAKYRKKPVVVEAEVYRPGLEDGWLFCWSNKYDNYEKLFATKEKALKYRDYLKSEYPGNLDDFIAENPVPYIRTLEGKHIIRLGDYIVTGIRGERYPIKPKIFADTYELVDE